MKKESLPGVEEVTIEKELLYDQYTLPDEYRFENTSRSFQWDKIKQSLGLLENFQSEFTGWGVLQNRNNVNGKPPVAKNAQEDIWYNEMVDMYGIEDDQAIPLYTLEDITTPVRYARDGMPVKIIGQEGAYMLVRLIGFDGQWLIPSVYIRLLDTGTPFFFTKVILVDRMNQHVTTLEKKAGRWLVRSMNPATTGIRRPPYRRVTPLGFFVLQEKKERMLYLEDGSDRIEGFALYANRFTAGGYLHGVAVEVPEKEAIEFCPTLGTHPESHMCVRNVTSHAKFIYDWAPVNESLICVIE